MSRWSGVARVAYQFLKVLSEGAEPRYFFSASGALQAHIAVQEHLNQLNLLDRFVGANPGKIVRRLLDLQQSDLALIPKTSEQALRIANKVRNPLERNAAREIDFFFSFFAGIPRQIRRNAIPSGLFVHDLIPLMFPQYCKPKQMPILKRILGTLSQEDLIITNSLCTKYDFCSYSGWDQSHVHVVPLGADGELFYPVTNEEAIRAVRKKYGIEHDRYYLSLHSFAPHKNMAMLTRAHSVYCQRNTEALPLVIAGGKDSLPQEVAAVLGVHETTLIGSHFIGYVDEVDLAGLYSGAQAFFFPSLYEGFGLPVVEAMYCGTPVYASERGSLPELLEDSRCLIDPEDTEAWADAFERAEHDDRLSHSAIDSIRHRYSWPLASSKLLQDIRTHLQGVGPP